MMSEAKFSLAAWAKFGSAEPAKLLPAAAVRSLEARYARVKNRLASIVKKNSCGA
jgi:hypothetical protein